MMNSNLLIKSAGNRYNRFLFVLFLLLVSMALPDRQANPRDAILMLFLMSMLLIIRQLRPGRWWLKYYSGLVLLSVALLGLDLVSALNMSAWNYGYSVFALIIFTVVSVPIQIFQQDLFSTQTVTADTLKGGIALYVLMGVAWTVYYAVLFDFSPNSFDGVIPSEALADLLHFSFTTLTTLGYGNILPMVAPARIASDLEAITGVLYPAILISRLVSNYTAKPEGSL